MRIGGSLIAVVSKRILLFALTAMVLQTGIVFADYWFDDAELGRLLIERETQSVAMAYRDAVQHGAPFPPPELKERYGLPGRALGEKEGLADGYWLRIRDSSGSVPYTNCHEECVEHFLPLEVNPPGFWSRTIIPGKPLTLVGGREFEFGDGTSLVVDFASIGDPNNLVADVILHEMIDHMIWPMGLMLVVVIGATILSIRYALQPVEEAVAAADALDPGHPFRSLPVVGLPSEISHLVMAVNRALARVQELIRSQKVFAASIAHEIRTPVSILKLELARIDDEGARTAERDLDALTHTLEQLTALARLDAAEGEAFTTEHLAGLAEDTVAQLAPLVFASGRQIGFEADAEPKVSVSRTLIVTLVRNLVENAMKHTPPGTAITVRVEAPARLLVRDDGPGFTEARSASRTEFASVKPSGSLGVGLRIAERIAALHHGSLSVVSTPGQGTLVTLDLPATCDTAAPVECDGHKPV